MATDLRKLHLHWYDYHLKGVQNGLDTEAPIRIFVMGDNVWRDEQEWPLARAKATPFYLHSNGMANTRMGDGSLSEKTPGTERSDRYAYDPRYPVPTYGGHGSGGGGITRDGAFSIQGPMDQRSTQQRHDVLVYTTDVLTTDTEVTGAPELQPLLFDKRDRYRLLRDALGRLPGRPRDIDYRGCDPDPLSGVARKDEAADAE